MIVSLDQLEGKSETAPEQPAAASPSAPPPAASSVVSLNDVQHFGKSDPFYTTPPPPARPFMDQLAGSSAAIVAGVKKLMPQATVFAGDLMQEPQWHKDMVASLRDSLPEGSFGRKFVDALEAPTTSMDNFGTKWVKQGLVAQEQIDAQMQKDHPGDANSTLTSVLSMAGYAGAGTLAAVLGAPMAVTTAAIAGGMGIQSALETASSMKEQGKDTGIWPEIAGVANGTIASKGFHLVDAEVGGFARKLLKNQLNITAGLFFQGLSSGTIDLIDGATPYKSPEQFKDIVVNAAWQSVLGGLTLGPMGAAAAARQMGKLEKSFVDNGMEPEQAKQATKELSNLSANGVLKYLEAKFPARPDQVARIMVNRPDVMEKLAKLQEKQASGKILDPLDYDFLPKEFRPSTSEESVLQRKQDTLEQIKEQVAEAKKSLTGNSESQAFNQRILDEEKQTTKENDIRHDEILQEHEAAYKESEKKQTELDDTVNHEKELVRDATRRQLDHVRDNIDKTTLRLKEEDAKLGADKPKSARYLSLEKQLEKYQTHSQDLKAEIDQHNKDIGEKLLKDKSAQLERKGAFEAKKTELEAAREKERQVRLDNIPGRAEARSMIDRLQEKAAELRKEISEGKEKLSSGSSALTNVKRELRRLEQGIRKGKVLNKEDIQDVQKQLTDLINDKEIGLKDKTDRDKFLSKLKQLATADPHGAFEKLMPEIREKIRKLNERAEKRVWVSDFKAIKWDKMSVRFSDSLRPLIDALDLHYRTEKNIKVAQSTIHFFEDRIAKESLAGEEGRLTAGEERALKLAKALAEKPNLTTIAHEDLRALHDLVMSEVRIGETEGRLVYDKSKRDLEKFATQIRARNAEHAEIKEADPFGDSNEERNKNYLEHLYNSAVWLGNTQRAPFRWFSGSGMPEIFRWHHEAFQAETELQKRIKADFRKIHEAVGIEDAMGKPIPKKIGEKDWTGKRAGSLDSYMKVYAQSFNEHGYRHLTGRDIADPERPVVDANGHVQKGSGLTPADVREIQAWIEKDHPEVAKAVHDTFEYAAPGGEFFKLIDDAVVRDKGHHLAVEDYYDPIHRLVDVPESDKAFGDKGTYGRGNVFSGFVNERVGSSLAFKDFSYYGDWMRHIDDMTHYIAFSQVLRDTKMVLSHPDVKASVGARMGKDAIPTMKKFMDDVAFGSHNMDGPAGAIYSAARQRAALAYIGMNVMASLKIMSQYPAAASKMGWGWQNAALWERTMNPGKIDKFIDENSLMMKNRPFSQEMVLEEVMSGRRGLLGRTGWDPKIRMLMLATHQEMDKIMSRSTWYGSYNRAMADMTIDGRLSQEEMHTEAVAAADRMVYETHPTGGLIYQPELYRQGELGKTLGMFHSAINKVYNLWDENWQDLKEGNIGRTQFAARSTSLALGPALLIGMMSLRRGFQKDELPAYFAEVSLGSNIMFEPFTKAWADKKNYGINNPLSDTVGALWNLGSPWSSEDERYQAFLETTSLATGLPISVMERQFTGRSFSPRKDR